MLRVHVHIWAGSFSGMLLGSMPAKEEGYLVRTTVLLIDPREYLNTKAPMHMHV